VYKPKNAPESIPGFGSQLRDQETAGRMLAKYADNAYALSKAGDTKVKENFLQPVCVHGVGFGKSALLSQGLELHKQHCQNKDLLELLKDENHPLAIHITFNSDTSYKLDLERNVELAVVRRVLASCLDLKWNDVLNFPLSDTLTINQCVEAIMAYHKKVCGMRNDQKVFIYLGIDEINQLIYYSNHKSDTNLLRNLAKAVQSLHSSNGFVSTLFAGTHFADMKRSFLGSGIDPLNLELTRLSDETIESMLVQDAGVSQHYIQHPYFQKLVEDIGFRMRAIGVAVQELEYEFNEQSIMNAKSAVSSYLEFKNQTVLSNKELQVVIGLVMTGKSVEDTSVPIFEGTSITLDGVQNLGMVYLVPHPDGGHSVFMSRITLEAFLRRFGLDMDLVTSAQTLFGFIDTHGPDAFEKFVAHFHGFKKAVFVKSLPVGSGDTGVSIDSFYSGALIGSNLLQLELQLKPASFPLNCPNGVMWLTRGRYPPEAKTELSNSENVANHLRNGGVVVNSKGAAIDVLAGENIRQKNSREWQNGVIAYGMKHTTIGDTKLKGDEVIDDYNKAKTVLENGTNHSKDKVIMVHFSNRELSEKFNGQCLKKLNESAKEQINTLDLTSMLPTSIFVHRGNIEHVVGPMFGRLLTSKGFYMRAENMKKMPFSTFARAIHTSCAIKELLSVSSMISRRLLR